MRGNAFYGQSGGPSSVINCSLLGVLEACWEAEDIEHIYGLHHGIEGVLNESFEEFFINQKEELQKLRFTPGAFLGSVRHKLKDSEADDSEYIKILEVFKKNNIRFFFYNGGNDSMDTCAKISAYFRKVNYECRVIGIPKTIDNDLMGTDFTPGYGSAAKYIATTLAEIALDTEVYEKGRVTIVEIMGRDTGWLTASSCITSYQLGKPELIYIPEVAFDVDKFLDDVNRIYKGKGSALVAISEGITDSDGHEIADEGKVDAFGHKQLGGASVRLEEIIKDRLDLPTRSVELNLPQRCASHLASSMDVEAALNVGKQAVKMAIIGMSDVMIGFERDDSDFNNVTFSYIAQPLQMVANKIKYLPRAFVTADGNFIEKNFLDYVLPLVEGENKISYYHGIPDYIKK